MSVVEDPTVARPRRRAVITGGTSGIGAAFARRLASDGHDLLLVARDADRLADFAAELSERHPVDVDTISADLSTDDGCRSVENYLRGNVDLLVNNAGMSPNRSFHRSTVADETLVLRLNVEAVMRLTLAALPGMVDRRAGAVINVSSVAGFGVVMPGSTYSASKAWVTNFSESVGLSVRRYGVRVMALCPGYTQTGYHQRAGIDTSPIPGWLWLQPDRVVAQGMRDLGKGRLVSVPDWRYKTAVAALRHAPLGLVRSIGRDRRGST